MKQRLSISISLIGVNAAVFTILYLYHMGFPIIGLSGAKPISIAEAYALAAGYLFGWEIGFVSIFVGGLISSYIVFSPPFYILNFLPASISALLTGLFKENKVKPLLLYTLLLIMYLLYPYVGVLWLYPLNIWFHILIASIYLIVYFRYGERVIDHNLGLFLIILLSTLAAQLTGSILFEILYYPTINVEGFKGIWMLTTLIYPVERILLAIGGYILVIGLKKVFEKYDILSIIRMD